MARIKLDRQTLAKFLPDHQSIVAFEQIFNDIENELPSGIEAATALANAAAALANLALDMVSRQEEQTDRLSFLPANSHVEPDDVYIPAMAFGTLGEQNADAVEITGGSIDGTTIGATVASTGAFTTLTASSTVTLSPANADVVLSPTGTGIVTISPATAGSINNINIGATTAGTIRGTTITATGAVSLSPANANVVLSPTGTGLVTINPATAGAMDNVAIGATTAKTVRGTTIESTVATGTAPLIIASTTAVSNLNSSLLLGKTWAIPDPIGATTPNTVAATTITATGEVRSTQAVGGTYYGMWSTSGNANNRNWAMVMNNGTFGNCQLMRSTANGGDPLSAGTVVWSATLAGLAVTAGFGCNGTAAQTAVASGGALAAYAAGANGLDTGAHMSSLHALVVSMRAALVANGIMS